MTSSTWKMASSLDYLHGSGNSDDESAVAQPVTSGSSNKTCHAILLRSVMSGFRFDIIDISKISSAATPGRRIRAVVGSAGYLSEGRRVVHWFLIVESVASHPVHRAHRPRLSCHHFSLVFVLDDSREE